MKKNKLQSVSENILDQILLNEHYEHFDTEDVPSLKDACCELAESISITNSLLENVPSLKDACCELAESISITNSLLENMNKLLQENNDNFHKMERALKSPNAQNRLRILLLKLLLMI